MKTSTIFKNRTIQLNRDFIAKVKFKDTGDNYNQFVSVFKIGEKMPIAGTAFKDIDNDDDIKNWANYKIENRKEVSHFDFDENGDLTIV